MLTVPRTNPDENDLLADIRPPEESAGRAESEVAELAKNVLDLSVVKDAVTRLHREDDERFAQLSERSGAGLADMLREHETFLRGQEAKFTASLSTDRQRRMFKNITNLHAKQSLARVRALRNRLIDKFHAEVATRQNQEFAALALRPENAFDDNFQTAHRDMILHNLENLLEEAPAAVRKERLDAAAREFYEMTLEKRLELDPGRMRSMLDAPSVRRVLGEDRLNDLEEKCAAAVRDDELEKAAREWVDEEADPAEAGDRAEASFADAEDRKKALDHYRYWRRNDNLRRFLALVVDIQKAWEAAAAGGCRRESIPAAIRRNRPGLHAFLTRALDGRRDNGGLTPAPNYVRFAEFVADYSSHAAMEKLRAEKEALKLMTDLGGPDGFAFQAVLRLVVAKSDDGDRALFRDMGLALAETARLAGRELSREEKGTFLERFVLTRKLRLERDKCAEIDAADAAELAERCWRTMDKGDRLGDSRDY